MKRILLFTLLFISITTHGQVKDSCLTYGHNKIGVVTDLARYKSSGLDSLTVEYACLRCEKSIPSEKGRCKHKGLFRCRCIMPDFGCYDCGEEFIFKEPFQNIRKRLKIYTYKHPN